VSRTRSLKRRSPVSHARWTEQDISSCWHRWIRYADCTTTHVAHQPRFYMPQSIWNWWNNCSLQKRRGIGGYRKPCWHCILLIHTLWGPDRIHRCSKTTRTKSMWVASTWKYGMLISFTCIRVWLGTNGRAQSAKGERRIKETTMQLDSQYSSSWSASDQPDDKEYFVPAELPLAGSASRNSAEQINVYVVWVGFNLIK